MQLVLPKKEGSILFTEGKSHKLALQLALAGLAAFLFAQCRALQTHSPFCVSFTAVVPFPCVWSAALGGVLGVFLAQSWPVALRITGALALTALVRLLLEKRFPASRGALVLPFVAFGSVLAAGLAASAFSAFDLAALLFAGTEAILAFFAAAFFFRALHSPLQAVGLRELSAQDAAVLLCSGAVFFMCGAGLTFGGLSPLRVAAALAVLFAARLGGIAAGALSGVCLGAALAVDPALRFLLGLYAVGGLAAGMFSSLGQYVMSAFFALSAAVCVFASGMNGEKLWCLGEVLIACAVFFLIPGKWTQALREVLKKNSLLPDSNVNRPVAASLRSASAAVRRAGEIVCETGARLDKVVDPEIHAIFAKLQQNICYGCGFKAECWSERYSETANDILVISGVAEKRYVKTHLEERCPRAAALALQIEQSYGDFVAGMAAKAKVREARGIVSDQFRAVSVFLNDLADQVAQARTADPARAHTLKTALSESGIEVDCLQYFTSACGKTSIEITMLEDVLDLDGEKIRKIFDRLTGLRFAGPEIAVLELRSVMVFEEEPAFSVLFGTAQLPLAENGVCGDCVRVLSAPDGRRVAVLSDGMGTGTRAAVDSVLAASLTERLLLGGFGFPCAMQLVNSALLVKSTDESIATLDGLAVNIYTAHADFFKAGAAASFLRRGSEVHVIEEASLPLGILRELGFCAFEAELEPGDIVLLVSDGVTAGDCGWINDELLAWSTNNMEDLATHIASLARLRARPDTADDISAVAVKIMAAK